MEILVTVREVYGNTLVYPVCDNAKRFAQLAGAKTLNERTLRLIRELGYTVRTADRVCEVR